MSAHRFATRTFSARMVLAGVALAASACLPGPELLDARTTAELIVTGVETGDVLRVRIADLALTRGVGGRDQRVTFALTLSPGRHEGACEVQRRRVRLCGNFVLDVTADRRAATSLDVDELTRCELPDRDAGVADDAGPIGDAGGHEDAGLEGDAGTIADGGSDDAGVEDAGSDAGAPDGGASPLLVFSMLTEMSTVPGPCGDGTCTLTTQVTSDGTIVVEHFSGTEQGTVDANELEALALDALSDEANAVFTNGCATSGMGVVTLTREVLRIEGVVPDVIAESQDVNGCSVPVVAAMRGRLQALRASLIGE
jgi:hypothetical protein